MATPPAPPPKGYWRITAHHGDRSVSTDVDTIVWEALFNSSEGMRAVMGALHRRLFPDLPWMYVNPTVEFTVITSEHPEPQGMLTE